MSGTQQVEGPGQGRQGWSSQRAVTAATILLLLLGIGPTILLLASSAAGTCDCRASCG